MKGQNFHKQRGGHKGGRKSQSNVKQTEISFFLIDKYKVGIDTPYAAVTYEVRQLIKDVGKGVWNTQDKCWVIQRQSCLKMQQKLQNYYFKQNERPESKLMIKVKKLENFVLRAEDILNDQALEIKIDDKSRSKKIIKYNSIQTKIDPEALPFYGKLFEFQKRSLKFGIEKHGRMLLADEMGVGKTIQSLAVAYIYKHEWPLLIVCPPTLKINWRKQIVTWYPQVEHSKVQLINSSKVQLRTGTKIMIISYDLAWRMKDMFDYVNVVIADEAHYLKSFDSKRSQALVPFLSSRKRVILLTGTPAFARPKQIFNLVSIVRPGLFKNFKEFGNRYCDPKWNHWSRTYDYNGCKNVKELHYLLKENIMLRRLKSQVLTQLPDKNRQMISLETDPSIVKQIKQILSDNKINKMETFFSEYMTANQSNEIDMDKGDKREEIMQAYRLSGMAKIKAVKEYIIQILQNNVKILVFAHHIKVLDEIQRELKNKKHKFMRIDGSVSLEQRFENVQKFQNDPEVLVALLSITAAGVGITLTAASTIVFAELHWTPALMIQAEDRAHRVGQKNSVNCHYLIGENTLDEMLYQFLEKKVLNVSSFVDGKKAFLNIEEIKKGDMGKISRKQITKPQDEEFPLLNPPVQWQMHQHHQSPQTGTQITSISSDDIDCSGSSLNTSKHSILSKKCLQSAPSRKITPQCKLDNFFSKKSKFGGLKNAPFQVLPKQYLEVEEKLAQQSYRASQRQEEQSDELFDQLLREDLNKRKQEIKKQKRKQQFLKQSSEKKLAEDDESVTLTQTLTDQPTSSMKKNIQDLLSRKTDELTSSQQMSRTQALLGKVDQDSMNKYSWQED